MAYVRKSGIKTKWILIIIGICMIIPVILVVGIFALVGGGLYFGSKNTEEYTCAMEKIRSDKESVELLGEPIEDGFLIIPNIEISGARRDVQFSVPVSGSKSSGDLSVISYRDGFRSDFAMNLEVNGKNHQIYKGAFPCQ